MESLRIPYMVTGSVAMIVYGEPRLTLDVDFVVALDVADIPRFIEAFPPSEFYCPPLEVIRVELGRERRGHFNLIHHESGFKADVYLHGTDPFHAWGLAHSLRVDIGGGQMTVAPPEYVIVRKLEYFREGGSDKHLRDILSMLPILDADQRRRLSELAAERHLDDLWAKFCGSP